MHAWILLGLAGLAEIGWVIGLKYSEGGWAVKTLPIGTAYAVWTGIGAVGAAIAGLYLFGESANAARLACIALIVAGVAGLKLSTPG
jgi:quaternary ammonium compound-resistance protein SugE